MGHYCARRTVNNVVNTLSQKHGQSFEDFINEATRHKWLLVLIIDDYTSIHTKRRPQEERASEAKTMCTIVVKAFKLIQAVPVAQANFIHDPNGIDIELCTSPSCMHNISTTGTYASTMPDWLTQAFFNPELQRQRLNAHQYCESDTVRTMRKMDDLHLADFVELRLKSKSDFDAAYDVVFSTGPLHISLNSREHIVSSFHPFFKSVYEKLFPRSKFADTPKPWRVSLILEIVYGGWTLIRQTVLTKFAKFKDLEYGTLLNLLDNYIPLVLSIYSISFKLNNFSEYFSAMIRIWIMFTCLQRRHYNKAPLVWINMCSHWRKYAPQLYELLCKYITIFDEYPVENTHSILRAQTKSSDTADQLRKKAKSIFQSKDKQSNFRSFFTAPKQFSFSHNQLQFLKVRCAQLLSSMLKKISQSPGQSSFSSRNRSSKSAPSHVTLPTMCSNNPMKTSVLPLGYHGEFKPDQTRKCDLPECQISSKDEDWTLLDGCFHSFHIACLNKSTSCPLCREFLQKKVKDLSEIAQQAILNPASDRPDSNNDNSETTTSSPSTDDMGNEHVKVRGMEREEFENVIGKLNDEISNLNPPPQPHVISDAHHGLTSNTRTSTSKAPPHCTKCHHPVRGHKRSHSNSHITCNFCPNSICVSSSSECTLYMCVAQNKQESKAEADSKPHNQQLRHNEYLSLSTNIWM
ncbi:hypothetical protein OS493_026907 [Desmophyllum pertusum]|uniref:RING-type domain-containing protein n=1 Tax=Desmophyllum pertusum TaxID=174260 RepID=A0A9X0CW55_9CNID|nr:hypothetical protein OS493_026907 [Desmophyllum pertusum]